MRRAIARPRPLPASAAEREPGKRANGSKIASRASGGTPGPWSSTRTDATRPPILPLP